MVKRNTFGELGFSLIYHLHAIASFSSEHSIVAARASVMIYDDGNKRWVPSGSSQGLSKVHIYHHSVNNTFRVVGRKLQDHEVVINCAILKGLKYNQATHTFHQWRDNRQVYGLNFTSKDDADNFAQAMLTALETLNRRPPTRVGLRGGASSCLTGRHPFSWLLSHGNREPYQTHQRKGSRGSNQGKRNGVIILFDILLCLTQNCLLSLAYMAGMWEAQQQQQQPQQQGPGSIPSSAEISSPQPMWPQQAGTAPPQPPPQAPPAPPAPPVPPGPPPPNMSGPPKAPPAPPMPAPQMNSTSVAPPAPSGPAPPPPPPLPSAEENANMSAPPAAPPLPQSGTVNAGGLAAALKSATLKKVSKPDDRASGIDGGNDGTNYPSMSGTLGRSGVRNIPGANDIMTEMARKLKERKAKAEGVPEEGDLPGTDTKKSWLNSSNGNGTKLNGSESPKPSRSRRFQSLTGQETFHSNGQSAAGSIVGAAPSNNDLEALKNELLVEMRKEIQKAKIEIIEAIKSEFNRR
ncbi:hypothetical protein LSH36_264g01019 [Paralvinella palmiformis]|uniref:WH1 domain-containing protein n=1 Tax=Paralvinella palmiformis TaxID=53620 RepID=A0AAD9JJX3_9ANNE|nr:hypothetical protein LSH36_264g01019 [Paralvinella palmiformis]